MNETLAQPTGVVTPINQPAASQCNGVGEKDPLTPLTDCACTG